MVYTAREPNYYRNLLSIAIIMIIIFNIPAVVLTIVHIPTRLKQYFMVMFILSLYGVYRNRNWGYKLSIITCVVWILSVFSLLFELLLAGALNVLDGSSLGFPLLYLSICLYLAVKGLKDV